jgi:type II secretory pathway pseudopilin PulG
MFVIAIVGILVAIVIPNILNIKDKATWAATKGNLDVIRSCLALYISDSDTNRYPTVIANWSDLIRVLPEANLPDDPTEAKIDETSFSYVSSGSDYTFQVRSINRHFDLLRVSPAGITPASYPH